MAALIVGFAGHSGVGKDTAARLLAEVGTHSVESVAIAAKVKAIAHSLYRHLGLEAAPYYELNREARHIVLPLIDRTPIEIWVSVGNGLRSTYANTWVDLALLRAEESESQIVCVTDVRFPNETNAIHRAGGVLVKVQNNRTQPLDTECDHALDDWPGQYDHELGNHTTEADLADQVRWLSVLLAKRLVIDKD